MNREELKSIFDALRNDPHHHLGLGDIRLTIAQQDEILDSLSLPPAEGAELNIEALLKQIDKDVEKPMVTAQFGDMWKSHAIEHYGFPELVNMAWRQGRRALLLEKELRAALQRQPQPTAEGAEEILTSLIKSLGEPTKIHNHIYEIRPYTVEGKTEWWMFHNGVGSGEPLAQCLNKFATLHAQKLADKMVSERLREEYKRGIEDGKIIGKHGSVSYIE